MSLTQTAPKNVAGPGLPGIAIIAKIRRVLILAVIAALVYPSVMVASQTYCPGGVDGSGGFIDASGQPTDEAPHGSRAHAHGPKGERQHGQSGSVSGNRGGPPGQTSFGVDRKV